MRRSVARLLAAGVAAAVTLTPVGAETITVTADHIAVDFVGTQLPSDLPGPDGVVSLREALIAAGNHPGPDTVEFAIPRPWLWQTFPAYAGRAVIDLSGTFSAPAVTGNETTVDFSSQTAATGDTNPDGGEVAFISGAFGPSAALVVAADDCLVRGLDSSARPIIVSGDRNRVVGITGGVGLEIYQGEDNVIGGIQPGDGNILSYMDIDDGAGNRVVGNTILTDMSVFGGTPGAGNVIGGPDPSDGNSIVGGPSFSPEGAPSGYVMRILGAVDTLVQNNRIGMNPDGLTSGGDLYGGNGLATGVWVGGSSSGVQVRDNRIAGIIGRGIMTWAGFRNSSAIRVDGEASDTTVAGNVIGLNVAGEPLGSLTGVTVGVAGTGHVVPDGVLIGGLQPGAGNVIAGHDALGVFVHLNALNVEISGNSIIDNAGLGIDLMSESGTFGVTPNDALDVDAGANGSQNFPELLSAQTGFGLLSVGGVFDSIPGESFRLEFFVSGGCDDSGFGEGDSFAGHMTVATDAGGQVLFDAAFAAGGATPGAVVTATATRLASGETSEFSACADITAFVAEPDSDVDGDGLSDLHEVDIGSDPNRADTDGDGQMDGADNCVLVTNPGQADGDEDGFGNRCDGDLNNDGVTNTLDLGLMKAVFFSDDAVADLDGDGVVNAVDLGVLKTLYFLPPGPGIEL